MEPPYELIRDGLASGRVIPFLGAGASLSCRPKDVEWKSPKDNFLPSGWELAKYLDERSGFPSDTQIDLLRVAQYYDGVAGRGGLDDELHTIFSRCYEPGDLHNYLAEFQNPLIVTTNYDTLLEEAFNKKGKQYNVVVYKMATPLAYVRRAGATEWESVDPQRLALNLDDTATIFKMHGSSIREAPEEDSYVITEDDYVDFLSRMSGQTAVPAIFGEPFRKSHFLFLGYGLRDWNLRVILHKIWKDWPRKYASWAIQEKADPLEREFWRGRKLTIFEMGIAEFLVKSREVAASV
ncbi:MAG: SIR2 family protein [Acidobacteriota bacterium]